MRWLLALAVVLTLHLLAEEEAVKPPRPPPDAEIAPATPKLIVPDAPPQTIVERLRAKVKERGAVPNADGIWELAADNHTERWWLGPDSHIQGFRMPNGEVVPGPDNSNRFFTVQIEFKTREVITRDTITAFGKCFGEAIGDILTKEEIHTAASSLEAGFDLSVNQRGKAFFRPGWTAGTIHKFQAILGKGGPLCIIEAAWIDPQCTEAREAKAIAPPAKR